MSYSSVLTQEEYQSWRLNPIIMPVLQSAQAVLGLPNHQFRVLDYGCGRGHTLLYLRQLGYQAFGADINVGAIERGRDFLHSQGLDVSELTRPIGPDGSLDFPPHSFHFVLSDQVFEHVADLTQVATTLSRVTTPEGVQFHLYPGKWRLYEEHIGMPLVHWLPKNLLRAGAILLCTALGVHAPGWFSPGVSVLRKARTFYKYSCDETFYRTYAEIRRVFAELGFGVQPCTRHPQGSWRERFQMDFGDCFLIVRRLAQGSLPLRVEHPGPS